MERTPLPPSDQSVALTRRRIDLAHGTVEVVGSTYERCDGTIEIGPPKIAAGHRKVSIPPHVLPDIERHLHDFVGPKPESATLTGPQGGALYRKTFARSWRRARTAVGVEHLHFHDLRHTGNTLAATTGASTKELMVRMGTPTHGPPSSTSTPPRNGTVPSPRHCRSWPRPPKSGRCGQFRTAAMRSRTTAKSDAIARARAMDATWKPPDAALRPQKGPLTWSGRRDSNPRPQPWQGCALPAEPRPREGLTLAVGRPRPPGSRTPHPGRPRPRPVVSGSPAEPSR